MFFEMPSFPERLRTSQQCNNSPGNSPLPNCSGKKKNVFKNVKLGVWIIQVEVKGIVVVLDSELFSWRYTQTQYYTLTTPTGSCGSKNERPNNTHLNLGGTQMSPVFLELRWVLLHLPLKLCKALLSVFILYCSQCCIACLSCDP